MGEGLGQTGPLDFRGRFPPIALAVGEGEEDAGDGQLAGDGGRRELPPQQPGLVGEDVGRGELLQADAALAHEVGELAGVAEVGVERVVGEAALGAEVVGEFRQRLVELGISRAGWHGGLLRRAG